MKSLYEILVPTSMMRHGVLAPIRTRYHRVWDKKVRDITGGLTILKPSRGHWISPTEQLFVERVIPVRIFCTENEMERIADMTAEYYNQEAIMYYVVSNEVTIKNYGKKG